VQTFIDIRDTFAKVGAWDKAVEACRSALSLEPDDAQLLLDLKNLEAELTMMQGQYEAKQDQGGYRTFVKDLDKQQELADEDAVAKTPQQIVRLIERSRKEFQENPDDHDVIQKYVRALVSKEAKKEDEEAVELLRKLWEESGQYKFKQQIGDIRIKQMNRALRQAKKKIEKDPKNVALKKKFKEFNDKKAKFEMKEYRDRAKNYPTDMSIKFELGKRLIYFKQTDEAIAALQEAQQDPKLRATSLQFLGQCYVEKGWLEESIATFKRAQEIHPTPDDKLGMALRYLLMDAYERRAKEEGSSDHSKLAKQVASQILQTNINYRDIKKRIEGIRKLDAEIQQKEKEAKPDE
jgi:tetratricopeptide (TPR) repeat protein